MAIFNSYVSLPEDINFRHGNDRLLGGFNKEVGEVGDLQDVRLDVKNPPHAAKKAWYLFG